MSGGGYRARLFHLGELRRMCELGVLEKIMHVSSVSGGSITAGTLAKDFAMFPASDWNSRLDRVFTVLKSFCSKTIDTGTIIGGVLNPFCRTSDLLTSEYEKIYGQMLLSSLRLHRQAWTRCVPVARRQNAVHWPRKAGGRARCRSAHEAALDGRIAVLHRRPPSRLKISIAARCAGRSRRSRRRDANARQRHALCRCAGPRLCDLRGRSCALVRAEDRPDFFDSTNRAAVSASARSLRSRLRSSSLMR